jgi:hypothetical protein
MLERLYGDAATQGSIVQHSNNVANIDPRAQHSNLGQLFGTSADGSENANDTAMNTYSSQALQSQTDSQAKQRELIQRALDNDITGEKQPKKSGGNIFGKILKTASTGLSFIPGVGQILAPAAAGLGGLINGDGVKSSLMNAGIAAIPMGGGKIAGQGVKAGIKAGLKKAAPQMVKSALMGGR